MRQDVTVKEHLLVSPFLVFFLVNSMQVGVGILGFEKYIAKKAGYDSWLTVILAGISINILIWMMYKILRRGNSDLIGIHRDLFGKWIDGILSCYFIFYFASAALVVLRTYVEVIQVWIFPQLPTWAFAGVLLVLAYSYTAGGFRIVAGLCFLSVVYGLPLVLAKFFPLQYAHYTNLLPMMDMNMKEMLTSTRQMTLSYLGFELLFLYYPFIKHPERSQKWAHYGVLFTVIVYLISAIASFIYFSEKQLLQVPWATLTLWKIVDLPFLQRFEYVGIAIWMFVVLPNICLGLWCASRGAKRVFKVKQRKALFVAAVTIFISALFFEDRVTVGILNEVFSKIGFYTIYVYIPLLFVIQAMIKKVREMRWQKS